MMRLDDIKVSGSFLHSVPNANKLEKCRKYFMENGVLDRKLVLNDKGYLIDGYIGYVVLRENGIDVADVVVETDETKYKYKRKNPKWWTSPTTYVYGSHKVNKKVYVWRVDEKTKGAENVGIGKRAIVETAQGRHEITITDVKVMDRPPMKQWIRRVLSCRND